METNVGALDASKPSSKDVGSIPNGGVSTIHNSVAATTLNNSSEAAMGRHLARRLVQIGVTDVFSVPGDFNLTLLDHLIAEPGLKNIGCCNELNAGYAADGYARSHGVVLALVSLPSLLVALACLMPLQALTGDFHVHFPRL